METNEYSYKDIENELHLHNNYFDIYTPIGHKFDSYLDIMFSANPYFIVNAKEYNLENNPRTAFSPLKTLYFLIIKISIIIPFSYLSLTMFSNTLILLPLIKTKSLKHTSHSYTTKTFLHYLHLMIKKNNY